jgi:hypothetical protein
MFLVTTFVELRLVAGRSKMRAGCPHAVSGRPMLIHTYMPFPCRSHAMLRRGLEKPLKAQRGRGMAWERHRRGMTCLNQTRPHCVNHMGKTQSKPLMEWNGRKTARKGHGNGKEGT